MLLKRRYKLPIQGVMVAKEPLTGAENDPIIAMPLRDLPDYPTFFDEETQQEAGESFSYTCLDYNIDEEWCEVELEASESFHNWLVGILPQLRGIQKKKGWKLDKTRMRKVKVV
ncbi:hypothetical protein ES708_32605 [subsurface metagenome]